MIRALDPARDLAAVADLLHRAADYIVLETGSPPGPDAAAAFFHDAPPGGRPETGVKLGAFEGGTLQGIADLAFGWPEPADAYLGLLLLAPSARGRGLGPRMLDHVQAIARQRNAPRLLLAVLDANPRGRAFWERQGFTVALTLPAARIGTADHVRLRMVKQL